MNQAYRSHARQFGGISLWMTALLMMGLTLIGMSFLYYLRYAQWPMQEKLSRWTQSFGAIAKEVKKGAGLDEATTLGGGIRKCKINGKWVYSDVDCLDNNATTQDVKLQDNRSPAPAPKTEKNTTLPGSLASDIQEKMIEKATK